MEVDIIYPPTYVVTSKHQLCPFEVELELGIGAIWKAWAVELSFSFISFSNQKYHI